MYKFVCKKCKKDVPVKGKEGNWITYPVQCPFCGGDITMENDKKITKIRKA